MKETDDYIIWMVLNKSGKITIYEVLKKLPEPIDSGDLVANMDTQDNMDPENLNPLPNECKVAGCE